MITIMQLNNSHKIFKNRAEAEKITATLGDIPHKIEEDPKGSGTCIIALYDEDEPGLFVMYL